MYNDDLIARMIAMAQKIDEENKMITQTMDPLLIVAGLIFCKDNNIQVDYLLLENYKKENDYSTMGFLLEELVILNIFLKLWTPPFKEEIKLYDFVNSFIPKDTKILEKLEKGTKFIKKEIQKKPTSQKKFQILGNKLQLAVLR